MARAPLLDHPFAGLFRARPATSRRASSWDRTGRNSDYVTVDAGETVRLLDASGPGCITHIYCAMVLPDVRDYRNAVLRCYWDGAEQPSVEVPLGDFFGVAHGRLREMSTALVSVNPGFGSSHGLNTYFPMPFGTGALVTLENRGDSPLGGPLRALWYHIEYELYPDELPEGIDRFHASYRQERPTVAVGPQANRTLHDAENLDGAENYVALDTEGAGRMVGLLLELDNVNGPVWYGEGDDMVFIDGEHWPPSIHGTGTEEIFGGGACPAKEYAGLYSGYSLVESPAYDGLVAMYRWYVHDPIHFARSLRWTVEHGHANNFANHYSSVAYWYQQPVATLPPLPPAHEMAPPLPEGYDDARQLLWDAALSALGGLGDDAAGAMAGFTSVCQAGEALYLGDPARALASITAVRDGGRGTEGAR